MPFVVFGLASPRCDPARCDELVTSLASLLATAFCHNLRRGRRLASNRSNEVPAHSGRTPLLLFGLFAVRCSIAVRGSEGSGALHHSPSGRPRPLQRQPSHQFGHGVDLRVQQGYGRQHAGGGAAAVADSNGHTPHADAGRRPRLRPGRWCGSYFFQPAKRGFQGPPRRPCQHGAAITSIICVCGVEVC